MARLAPFAGWFLGAIASALVVWTAVVYVLDEFDAGYGRDNWFAVQLYLSSIAIVIGFIGYLVVTLFRSTQGTFGTACLAGFGFMICQLILVFVLGRVYPDRDMVAHGLVGALAIGSLSIFLVRSNAA